MLHLASVGATTAGLASGVGAAWLYAQTEGSTAPTSILGAFIAIALSMCGLLGWIVRELFKELKERSKEVAARQELFEKLLSEERAATQARSVQDRDFAVHLVEDFKVEVDKDRQHIVREREQTAELADAERRQRSQEHRQLLDVLGQLKAGGK